MAKTAPTSGTIGHVPDATTLDRKRSAVNIKRENAARSVRINKLLSDTIAGLANGNDLRAAMDCILVGLARELDAIHIFLFRHDPATRTLRLESSYIDGTLRAGSSGEEMALWAAPFPDDITPAWKIMTEHRGLFTPEITPIPAEEFGWPGAFDYVARFELSDVGHIVLFAGDVPVGSIGVGLKGNRKITQADKRFIEEVANQAAVAIRMLDLGEQAKEMAVLREREKAIADRTSLVHEVNQALQKNIDSLTDAHDTRAIFLETLRTIADVLAPLDCFDCGIVLCDAEHEVLRLRAMIRSGNEVDLSGSALDLDWAIDRPPMAEVWARIQREEFVWGLTSDASALVPEARDFHESAGARAVAYCALRRGEKIIGWVAINLRSTNPPTLHQMQLIRTLGGHASMALEMERLAERAKESAVLIEREASAQARAAALAQANEALRRGAERMATASSDSSAILDIFLLESIRAAQADAGVIVLRMMEESTECVLQSLAQDGEFVRTDHPHATDSEYRGATSLDKNGVIRRTLSGETVFFRVDEVVDWFPEDYVYHRDRGHKVVGHFPLITNKKVIGYLGLAFRSPRSDAMMAETVKALAVQASMALEMKRLADEARASAVALEQDRASKERAAEIATANESMTNSLRRMATESNLSRMPGVILLEICSHAHADACCWFDYDSEGHTLKLTLRGCQGSVTDQSGAQEPPLFRLPFSADITPAFKYLLATDGLVELSAPELVQYVWPGVMEWHERNGRSAMLACAVRVGDQPVGVLGIGFYASPAMSRSQRELIRALANHLALAVYLTRLSKRANSVALLNERNRIARDIHDSLAQNFTGILMQLQAATRFANKNYDVAGACVVRAESLARKGLKEARRSVMSLMHEEEHYQDLGLALNSLVETATADTGIDAVVSIAGDTQNIHPLTATNLLRVCQEALGNAQRYARASRISIRLTFSSESIHLAVEDDGIGFIKEMVLGSGFGLAGMQERAERINGVLTIDSLPGRGTRIELDAPLDRSKGVPH